MSQDDHAPTPISPAEAVAQFADAWEAGGRPQVREFARLVAPADEDAFYDLIEDYLLVAPFVALNDQAREELHRDPLFIKVMDATIHLENLLNDLEVPEDLR